ncbi:MAG: MipA/OmpV family protein [Alphaproteobacteria bacterium]
MKVTSSKTTKLRMPLLGISALAASMTASPVLADEERAKESLLREHPTAQIESVDEETLDGETVYEIEYELDGEDYEALYDADGRLLDVEVESGGIPLNLGISVEYSTEHYRGTGSELEVLPAIFWDNGTFFIEEASLGFRFYRGLIDAAAFVEVDFGAGYDPDDSDFLDGLDELDTPVNLGVLLEKETDLVDLSLSFKADVAGAYSGYVAAVGVGKEFPLTDWLVADVGAEVAYYDKNYNDYYYGVDGQFALANRPAYEADGDFNYELEVGLRSEVFDGLTVFTNAEYTLFGSEVKDSPLTEGNDQLSIGIGFAYEIGKLYDLVF